MKRFDLLEPLRNLIPGMLRLRPAAGGMQLHFASAGGGGGDDYDPDDDFYDDEPIEDEPAPRRQQRTGRRPTAARQQTVQTDPDERYWTDYLRIALPVIGLLLVIAVFWYWAQQLIDNDSSDLTPTEQPGVAELVDTPTEVATEAPATPPADTGSQGQQQAPQGDGTPTNPLQAFPSPTPPAQAQQQDQGETGGDNQVDQQTEEPPADTGGIAPDTQVTVTEGPLNLRSEASTDSDIVVTLDTGAVLDVLSGPEEGDNYVWWQVTDDQANIGWVAEDFIEPAG